jgi:endo-1,4-beta-xylanase
MMNSLHQQIVESSNCRIITSANQPIMSHSRIFLILFLGQLLFSECTGKITDEGNSTNTDTPDKYADPLKVAATFPVGTVMSLSTFSNGPAIATVKKEFSSVTCENAMKIAATQPTASGFVFTEADSITSYCIRNGIRVHGHTLVWHQSLPSWLTTFQGDSAAWENILKNRIKTMLSHFKGRVKSWDVVNEAFNDDGTLRAFASSSTSNTSLWAQKLGKDYVARCFQYAHEADPDAKLFYNDYGQEYSQAKTNAILAMVTDFKKRGIPIDGLGLQFHTNIQRSDTDLKNAISQLSATGLLIHISELDISMNGAQTYTQPTSAMLDTQKNKMNAIAAFYKTIPVTQQFGITFWGISDVTSWIKNDWPLLFDATYAKKPAYYGFWDGLKQ